MTFDAELNATIPKGTRLRIVARSGTPALPGGRYIWHGDPDGGACYETTDGGWIYVSNCEIQNGRGGVGALRFDAQGRLIDSYPILEGTNNNCAGGKTPWGTWLSCEESGDKGLVYECDPYGRAAAQVRPGLGAFNHEAAAVDPANGTVYLTEDRPDGCLYRFVPVRPGDLAQGRLEVALRRDDTLIWVPVPDPSGSRGALRRQVQGAAKFRGGEGIVYTAGIIYFTTKGDDRVWALATETQKLSVVYDARTSDNPILTGVDNIEVSPNGDLLIAEDGGDMQIVALRAGDYKPIAVVTLHDQPRSEVAGPAFTADGRRLYFSSQKGIGGREMDGITYELDFGA